MPARALIVRTDSTLQRWFNVSTGGAVPAGLALPPSEPMEIGADLVRAVLAEQADVPVLRIDADAQVHRGPRWGW